MNAGKWRVRVVDVPGWFAIAPECNLLETPCRCRVFMKFADAMDYANKQAAADRTSLGEVTC